MGEHEAPRDHLLSNTTYDGLKRLAQVGLPGLGTLYFALSMIWGWPYGEEVVGSIVAVDAFLGLLLGYSSKSYHNSSAKYDGAILVSEDEDRKLFDLRLDSDPNDLDQQDEVLFKIEPTKQNSQNGG